jgi:2-(1,2-epoxy-1,2-dihydrophenyl)acetyl-CoA isomerase
MSGSEEELIVRDAERVRWIALNRPRSKNGLTVELNARIIAALEEAAGAKETRVVVLTGEGGAFCSGLDLKSAQITHAGGNVAELMDRYFHGLIRAVRRIEKPVIALVDGAAAGFGCDLALACDFRLGTPRTRFGEVFIQRGLMPDGGGTYHLPRVVGLGRAMELLFTGEMVGADEALRLGLVNRLLPVESAAAETMALGRRIAAGPPRVHAWIKRAVYSALSGTLDDALAVEAKGQLELLQSRDFFEGVSAFFQKRPPDFTGE